MHTGRIKRNAESCPLLRLPLEILRKIFVEVLGDRLIHLKKFDDDWMSEWDIDDSSSSRRHKVERWHILVCDPAAAEPIKGGRAGKGNKKGEVEAEASKVSNEGMDSSDSEEEEDDSTQFSEDEAFPSDMRTRKKMMDQQLMQIPNRRVQHLIGHDFQGNDSWRKLQNPFLEHHPFSGGLFKGITRYKCNREIHLCLLRTCRQVYTEANKVLWETNIFSFNDIHSFNCFMNERNNYQKGLMKKLRLAMKFGLRGPMHTPLWSSALTMQLVRSLQGLRFVWLAINYRQPAKLHEECESRGWLDSVVLRSSYLEGVRKLATLPLAHVKVSVSNKDLGYFEDLYFDHGEKQWSQQQRKKYADLIRTRLLDVDGDKLFQQENHELKKRSQRGKEDRGGAKGNHAAASA